MAKEKAKAKTKAKANTKCNCDSSKLPAASFKSSVDNSKITADYTKILMSEKPINHANISQNMKDVQEYSNILTGNNSSMLNAPVKSLGRVYAYNTNETCVDNATGAQVPRYTVIDTMNPNAKGFINSANYDFEKSKTDINYVVNADKFPMKCMSVPIIETDINGNSVTNPYYIMIAEIDKLPASIFPNNKKPTVPNAQKKEYFASVESLATLDAGQTFFVGSIGVIGLYIYFKMLYGHSK